MSSSEPQRVGAWGLESHPSSKKLHVFDNGGNGHAEAKGRNGEIGALQPEGRKAKMNPKPEEKNPAMGRAIQRGKLHFNTRITLVKAPMAKNPACPIEIWPVYQPGCSDRWPQEHGP